MNEKQVLDNLFRQQQPVSWYGVILQRLARTRYELEDMTGRVRYADADPAAFYPAGAKVIVQNGRIIGSGQLAGNHKIFDV